MSRPIAWICPGCHMTIEARAVAAGHRCPNHGTRWVDFSADESITQDPGSRSFDESTPADQVADPESWGDSNPNQGVDT